MERIDRHTEQLLREASGTLGAHTSVPRAAPEPYAEGNALQFPGTESYRPATVNPPAEEIPFQPMPDREEMIEAEADEALDRLEGPPPPEAERLDINLRDALAYAMQHAREYRTAEEEYILAALRLLIERHLWGPRFFDEISAIVSGAAEDNSFDSALSLVNEFRVTQRLPWGGEVAARLLARATEDLRLRVAGEEVQDAEVILSANVPLLRGAGLAAVEPRIQAERDLIYGARRFERFRREFLVDIARDFLNLVVQLQNIENARAQLNRFVQFEQRARELVEAGREPAFQRALAAQDVFFAQDRLRSQEENYRFAVDRFKVRLGIPVDLEIRIVPSSLGLPTPLTDMEAAVRQALDTRLDLQTARDELDDTRRAIDIAANQILPDLNLSGAVSVPTDDERARSGLRFNTEDSAFSAGVTFGLPLDREIERLRLRQAQIDHERAIREYDRFRDTIIIEVRDAVREIDRALFSLQIQERNIEVAQERLEALEIRAEATALDRSEAAQDLTEAQDARDAARRDLEVAILEYLLSTGTLRVDPTGRIQPLAGMTVQPQDFEEEPGGANNNN